MRYNVVFLIDLMQVQSRLLCSEHITNVANEQTPFLKLRRKVTQWWFLSRFYHRAE